MSNEEHLATHDRQIADIMQALKGLATAAERHAAAAEKHDEQIEALLIVAEQQAAETKALRALVEDTMRQWQAYLTTVTPRH